MAFLGGILDKLVPDSYGLSEQDKSAVLRQGLLASGLAMLGSRSGGNFGQSLADGLSSGLLAVNKGADNIGDQRYKQAMTANQAGGGSEFSALDKKLQAAGYQPGTDDYKKGMQINLGVLPRAVTGAAKPQQITGADGVDRIGTFDPSTRQWSVFDGQNWVVAGPGQAPSAVQAATQQMYIDPSLPPQVQAAIRANPDSPQLGSPQAPLQGANPGLFAGRPKEQEAAAVAGAQAAATLPYTQAEIAYRTDQGIRGAGGEAAARGAVELQQSNATAANEKTRAANSILGLAGEARKYLPQAGEGMWERTVNQANQAMGRSTPQTQANQQLKIIAGQLTAAQPKMSGPQSDKDVALYKEMAGDVANESLPRKDRLAALDAIEALQRKYAGQRSAPNGQKRLKFNPATGKLENGN